jgi:hypothetical protein
VSSASSKDNDRDSEIKTPIALSRNEASLMYTEHSEMKKNDGIIPDEPLLMAHDGNNFTSNTPILESLGKIFEKSRIHSPEYNGDTSSLKSEKIQSVVAPASEVVDDLSVRDSVISEHFRENPNTTAEIVKVISKELSDKQEIIERLMDDIELRDEVCLL